MKFALEKLLLTTLSVSRSLTTTSSCSMKLIQFLDHGKQSIGVQTANEEIINLTEANNALPNNVVDFLKGGQKFLDIAKDASSSATKLLKKSEVKILPPVTGCEKVVCVGLNYKDHCLEQNLPIPEEPVIFSKFPSSIIGLISAVGDRRCSLQNIYASKNIFYLWLFAAGDGENIILPKASDSVDWEVELVVVIGKEGKHIKADEASEYIAGYTVANDVSARDWQMKKNAKQWLLGKTFDTFCPIGPVLVTKDDLPNAGNLDLKCTVNGEVMQSSNTNQLVYSVEECIAWVSKFCTLKPGDLILTGTPPGVGVFRKPPIYLKDGDTVVCEIENIGKITNRIVAEE